MALWLLEAKAFPEDDREEAARVAKFYLKPGTYTVGRAAGTCDIDVTDDKSISRKHAEIIVPGLVEGAPYVVIKDSSRYGTQAAQGNQLEGHNIREARVYDKWYCKFGYKSPFRLYLLDYRIYFLPAPAAGAAIQDLQAAKEAAAAAGLRVVEEPGQAGTLVVSLTHQLEIGPEVLLALLRGLPAVTVAWVMRWAERRVWRNERPEEAEFPVHLAPMHYTAPDGSTKAALATIRSWADVAGALAARRELQFLEGKSFYFPDGSRDEVLAAIIELMGGTIHSGRAPGKGSSVVVVRPAASEAGPAKLEALPWTTPQLLVAGVMGGSLEVAIRPGQAATPPSTGGGKGRKRKAGKSPEETPATSAGRKRRARARPEPKLEPEPGGSDTDVTADSGPPRAWQTQLLPDEEDSPAGATAAAPAPSEAASPTKRRQQQQQHVKAEEEAAEEAVEEAADEHALAAKQGAGGRKRKAPAAKAVAEQLEPPVKEGAVPQETPSAKRRKGAEAAQAAAGGGGSTLATPAAAPPVEPAAPRPAPQPPLGDGWHQKAIKPDPSPVSAKPPDRKKAKAPAPEPPPPAPAPAPPAAGKGKGRAATGGRRRAGAATAAAEADDFGMVKRQQADQEALPPLPERDASDVEERTVFEPLVVASARPPAPEASEAAPEGGPNFKAFRKARGGARGAPAAAALPALIPFDPEPYEEGRVDAEAFLRAEKERRKLSNVADELFAANVKARKAAPLPSVDDEAPAPAKGGRGRGRGSKAAAAGGQQSMLSFLPAASTGRGRGRGRGKGKG